MDRIEFRELRVDDPEEKANLLALVNLCYRGSGNWTSEKGIINTARLTADELERDLCDAEFLVATEPSGRLVGCIKWGVTTSTLVGPLDSLEGCVGLFAVHPDFGSKGLGKRLLQTAEDLCRSRGMTTVVLNVLSARSGLIKMYERKGYLRVPNAAVAAAPVYSDPSHVLIPGLQFILLPKTLDLVGATSDVSS